MNRRRFLQGTAALAGASWLRVPLARGDSPASLPSPARILVLGGTSFLGPALVREAVVAGHTVTLFNRGITNPDLFPRLEKVRGLRSVTASEERWDAIGSRRFERSSTSGPTSRRSPSRRRAACEARPGTGSTCRRSPRTTRRVSRRPV